MIIVAGAGHLSVDSFSREALEDVVVQPLAERRVLARLLNNFLGNNTTKESSHRRDGAASEADRVLQDILVDLDVGSEGLELGGGQEGLGELKALIELASIGVGVVLLNIGEEGTKGHVQLLTAAKLTEVGHHELAKLSRSLRVHDGSSPVMVRDLDGHLDVLASTLSSIVREAAAVKVKSKREGRRLDDLGRGNVVYFYHAFDFTKLDIVTLLVGVSLVFMDLHNSLLALVDVRNDERLLSLAISIGNNMLLTEVQEGRTKRTEGSAVDKASVTLAASGVQAARVDELIS